jgi:hypothetical protein
MSDGLLEQIRGVIQQDVNQRGLAADPHDNLFTACRDDFANACRSIAQTTEPTLAVVTGFFIPHAQPACGETDGPLGALFLVRALQPLGIRFTLLTDDYCRKALEAGLRAGGLDESVNLVMLQKGERCWESSRMTHLIALERVGPGPDGRCRNMHGRDVTAEMASAHLLFEAPARSQAPPITIGIGDGGNEIGMGKIAPELIARNVRNGEHIACRVPTDHLIVAGVSNWGAYALAAGVAVLRRQCLPASLFDAERERDLLRIMMEEGPLVDGVTARPSVTVDGLSFEKYIEPLQRIGELLEKEQWLTCEQPPGPR